jgi:ferredoxin-NADP reductase
VAGTALRRRLIWQVAKVSAVTTETASVRTIPLDVPDWPGHQAGQHLDIRLTDEDGYVAERSYSIASAPGEPVAITVERLDDGEVSPYLTEELRAGDDLELRGPIGGYFTWAPEDGGPLLLLGGGSGVVPLRSILRYHERTGSTVPVRMLYSSRTLDDVIYRAELDQPPRRRRHSHADPPPAARLGWLRAPRRRSPAGRGGVAHRRDAAGLRLRPDQLRRDGIPGPGAIRLPAAAGEDRALRRNGRNLMEAVDGNAIGGLMHEVFGTEMTAAASVCETCGDARPVAELVVYLQAPGTVVRCRTCDSVLMVFVTIHDRTCVDLQGLAVLG